MRLFNLSFRLNCVLKNAPLICGGHGHGRVAYSTQKQLADDMFGAQYCMDLVQKSDYENYLCTLLLSGEQRRQAFALRAFNVEVAKSTSQEEAIGKMRLKFWYDSIDKCFDTQNSYVADHPVLREIRQTIAPKSITKGHIKRLVNARDRAPNAQFVTLKQMEEYAEQTCTPILYLLVELCGFKDLQIDHAVSHLGKAQGITNLLRAIPYKSRSQALNIPQEILIKHGVSQERIVRDQLNDKGVEECIFEVATAAHQHLEKARQLSESVPKEVRKVFLPAVPVARYLERLRTANFRLTDQNCLRRDNMLPTALFWYNLRKKY